MSDKEKTCKDCEHYEFYDGPRKIIAEKAIMYCKKHKNYHNNTNPALCEFFTPKKPAEKEVERGCGTCKLSSMHEGGCPQPETILCTQENNYDAWQPIEKEVKKDCSNCRHSKKNNATGQYCTKDCCYDSERRYWQPQPKPGQATEPEEIRRREYELSRLQAQAQQQAPPGYMYEAMRGSGLGGSILHGPISAETEKPKTPKKAKENKMWKKLRKRGRRITMAWDLFGLLLLCRLVNPWVCEFWRLVPIKQESGGWDGLTNGGHIVLPWFLTIVSIAAILGALYGLDRLAAWWYGEDK